jgi:exopolysaccharide biosynthesis polyprenyl glycosylphosphotransferase
MANSVETRLLSRPYFLEHMRREKLRALRSKSPLSVVLLRFEEKAGAELHKLRKHIAEPRGVLQPLKAGIRETDILGHLGDDVIGILLPDTDEKGTQKLVAKLVNGYKDLPFSILTGTYPDQVFERLQRQPTADIDLSHLFLEDSAPHKRYQYALKRAMDILGALIGILVFSPVMLVAAIAVKATSPGPVLFKQTRLGKRGVPFVFFKFRSMYVNNEDRIHREYVRSLIAGNSTAVNQGSGENPFYKIKSDPRITKVGRLIRKRSIDELPQFFNVLKGEMSLVGPRPPLPYEAEKYQSWHIRRILEVKPGITGLWQVSGRSKVSFDDMVRLDLQYARDWSIGLDTKILFKTPLVVTRGSEAA